MNEYVHMHTHVHYSVLQNHGDKLKVEYMATWPDAQQGVAWSALFLSKVKSYMDLK